MSILKGKQLGNAQLTGSLYGTSSFAMTASYALNAGVSLDTGSLATTGSNDFVGNQTITGSITTTGLLTVQNAITTPSGQYFVASSDTSTELSWQAPFTPSSPVYAGLGSNYAGTTISNVSTDSNGDALPTTTWNFGMDGVLTAPGRIEATSFTGSLQGTASYASQAAIQYVPVGGGGNRFLSEIEVADYDNNVAVTYVNGRLKFIFGTPTTPSPPSMTFNSTFATDRFNKVTDNYDVSGSWDVGGYTLISASIWEGSTRLISATTGTSLTYNTTTSGSHTYTLQVTASSPLDNSINAQSVSLSGTLSKSNPGAPTITPTATVQLGATSNLIEQGATGSITFTSASGATNNWVHVYTSTNVASPIFVTGSATGSTSISATATSYYSSSGVLGADNNPALTTTSTNSFTYTKIRSLRYGASTSSSFTAANLENLSLWDITLGGSIGYISKGTTTATGQSLTITWTGDKYHYIIFNSGLANLTDIKSSGFTVFGSFTLTTVGSYKVYKSNSLLSGGGGAGTSITYVLT
jgi:hypothetical protein